MNKPNKKTIQTCYESKVSNKPIKQNRFIVYTSKHQILITKINKANIKGSERKGEGLINP